VVISSHGRGGSGKGEITQWVGLANSHGFIVACPDMCTATVNRPPRSKLRPEVEDEEVVLSILDFLAEHYRVNPRAVMITGYSGGGNPSYWTGLRHPDRITHICTRGGNFAPQQVPGDEKTLASGRDRTRIYIYYGEKDHPLILGEGGKPGQAVMAYEALKKAGYRHLEIEKIPGMKHQSRADIAAEWFGVYLKENRKAFAAGDQADLHLAKAREAVAKGKYRVALRELKKVRSIEEKAGLTSRSGPVLERIDEAGRARIAEARAAWEAGDAAEARKIVGRVARDFRGVPAGDEAKRLKDEWKP
jgi:hypothetical protein